MNIKTNKRSLWAMTIDMAIAQIALQKNRSPIAIVTSLGIIELNKPILKPSTCSNIINVPNFSCIPCLESTRVSNEFFKKLRDMHKKNINSEFYMPNDNPAVEAFRKVNKK